MNAVRVSRGPWALASFADDTGLMCTENFQALWLKDNLWTTRSLAAVLNAPLACAFIAVHEGKLHVRKLNLQRIPLPQLGRAEIATLDRYVDHYLRTVEALSHIGKGWFDEDSALLETEETRHALLQIDALVLKGYNLPPRLERQLLDFFRGAERPVPFPFTEYFPESFTPTIPLWMYISPEYKRCTADYFLKHIPKITDSALIEALQEVE